MGELRTMAAAVSNLLGVATTPRGTYQAAQITQAELHWGIRRLLQLLARDRPVVLMLEDLHWAEPTLIELIHFLLEEQEDVPMLIVCSGRTEAAEANPGLVRDGVRACALQLEARGQEHVVPFATLLPVRFALQYCRPSTQLFAVGINPTA